MTQRPYMTKKEICYEACRAPATIDRWEKAGKFPRRRVSTQAWLVFCLAIIISAGFIFAAYGKDEPTQISRILVINRIVIYWIPFWLGFSFLSLLGNLFSAHFLNILLFLVFLIGLAWFWFWFQQRYRESIELSYKEYARILRNKATLQFHPHDLWQRISDRLGTTSLDLNEIISEMHDIGASDIPSPPTELSTLLDRHFQSQYRQHLRSIEQGLGFSDPEREKLFVETMLAALRPIANKAPAISGPTLFQTTVMRVIDAGTIPEMVRPFLNPRLAQLNMFVSLRRTIEANKAAIEANPNKYGTLDDIAHEFLKDTPFLPLFQQLVPINIPDWYAHTHIVAPTGAFKTQLLQTILVHHIQQPRPPSFLIIDSQGAMLPLIESKLGSIYGKRLIHIDPKHNPIAINPLDIDITGMVEEDQFATLNRLSQLFANMFQGKDAELSDKMEILFNKILRLLLYAWPKTHGVTPTLKDMQAVIFSSKPWDDFKAAIDLLPPDEQRFFSKANYADYSETRLQVNRRLDSVLNDPFLKRMLTAEKNELDLDNYLNSGGIVLVNTNLDALQEDNSAFFGRLFIMFAQQTMMRRQPEPQSDPYRRRILAAVI